ncbi:hypothetical protein NC651_029943 [Populus alba x Populus x berolinensis]|nr:hypothetical protein NC651_029943 [Populus alba x Populus x berolinensis]
MAWGLEFRCCILYPEKYSCKCLTAAYKHCFPRKIRQVSRKSLTLTSRCQPGCATSSTTWVRHPLLNWLAQRDPTSVGIACNDSTLSFECEIDSSHPAISR